MKGVAEYNENHLLDVQTYRNTRKQLEYKLHRAIEKDEPVEKVKEIQQELNDLPPVNEMKLITTDVTAEALAGIMSENDEAMGILSPEGGIFDVILGMYSSSVTNLNIFLSGYDGEPVKIDRKYGSVALHRPLLTFGICAQPQVLNSVINNPQFSGKGLTQRFLFCIPDSMIGHRKLIQDVNGNSVTRAYSDLMFAHYDRTHSSSSSNIDESRTHLNYNLAEKDQPLSCLDFLHKRMSEIKVLKRANVNVMCDWVITAPEDLTDEELPVFFDECYKFLNARYGKENVISAPVHMDEISPHIHYNFVPVVTDKKKGIPKLSSKECITRKDLNTFHTDLTKHMTAVFGRDIGILNGATVGGNKTIKQLKQTSENLKAFKAVPIEEESSAVYKLLGKDKVVVKRSELDRLNKAVEDAQLISSNQDSIIADLTEQKRKADRKNEKAEERLRAAEEKADSIIADAKTEAENMTSAICSEKAEWEKKRSEQQAILDKREKELSERSEELARAEQLVNEQAEINEASAERNLALATQLEQAGQIIEEERCDLMKQKNSPHEYYGEIIFEKNTEINSKEAEIADLYSTISDKDSRIADMNALLEEKESKIQTLNCRIVSNENAHRKRLFAELERQEHILTEKHEKEVSELNGKISALETTLKALTDKFNDAMTFIKELCMSAATLIFAKNECRADLTKPQRNVIDAICNAGSALCRKFGKTELAEEIDTKYGLGDSIAEEYERLSEKDRSQRRSNSGPCL